MNNGNNLTTGLTKREYFAALAMTSIQEEVKDISISLICEQLGIHRDEYTYAHFDQFFAIRCKERANSLLKELED
jgi:hypothetical protein